MSIHRRNIMADCDCDSTGQYHNPGCAAIPPLPKVRDYNLIDWTDPRPDNRHSTFIVTIDWDGIPGWGYHGDRHEEWLLSLLRDMVPHYHPTVTRLDSDMDDYLRPRPYTEPCPCGYRAPHDPNTCEFR
jgi:hypothetical protein